MADRTMVYPYSEEWAPILRYSGLLQDFDVEVLAAPKSWGLDGKTELVSGREISICDEDVFQLLNPETTTLIIPDFDGDQGQQQYFAGVILENLGKFKRVINCAAFPDELKSKLVQESKRCGCEFKDYAKHQLNYGKRPLKVLSVPIVVVAGFWKDTDKFSLALALRKVFLGRGFRVSQVGSREYCELLGFHSFPWNIFDQPIADEEKIYQFNEYMDAIIKTESPDIVLLSIPAPLQSASWDYPGGFGAIPYLIFRGITVDYLILCTFLWQEADKLFDEFSSMCEYRFGIPVDYFYLSNTRIDANGLSQTFATKLRSLPEEEKLKILDGFTKPVIGRLDHSSVERVVDDIVDKLS